MISLQQLRLVSRTGTLLIALMAHRFAVGAEATVQTDLISATIGDIELKLDLHLPPNGISQGDQPLIVWVHGGAWRAGSKSDLPLAALAAGGYPIASVDYRLSTTAKFPAQVHDLKAAIRYLRGNSKKLGIHADRIVIAGSSAGGHLAALVGTSNGSRDLEGTIGDDLRQSSAVQGIVSFYGMSNLTTILDQSTPHGLKVRVPALDLLLGGQPKDQPELARLASPVFHVSAASPPLLLFHGDQDPQAPINQSHELQGKYEEAGLHCDFVVLHGSAHGGKEFFDDQRLAILRKFMGQLAKPSQ